MAPSLSTHRFLSPAASRRRLSQPPGFSTVVLLLLTAVTSVCFVPALSSPPGMCATYGHCADYTPPYFTPIDCVNHTAAVRPDFPLPLCPHLSTVCCDQRQYEEFADGYNMLQGILGSSCPACLHNFRTYLCAYSCSGNQSQFLSVNATSGGGGGDGSSSNSSVVVTAVNVAVSRSLMTTLYDSCKDVVAPNTGLPVFADFSVTDVLSFMAAVLNSDQSPAHSFFTFSEDDDNALTLNNVGAPLYRCDTRESNLTCACSSCPTVCQRCPQPAAAPNDSSLVVDAAYPSFGHNFLHRIAYSCAMAFCAYLAVLLLAAMAASFTAGPEQRERRTKYRTLVAASAVTVLLVLTVYVVSAVWVDLQAAEDVTVGQEAGMVHLLASYFDPLFFTFLLVSLILLLLALCWLVYRYSRAHPFAFHYDPALLYSASSFTTSTVRPSALLRRYSAFVASHPYLMILAAVGITALCGLGLLSARLESDPIALWVSPSSQVLQDKRYFDATFGPFYRTEQLIVTAAGHGNASVINSSTLVFVSELTAAVRSLVVRYEAGSSSGNNSSSGSSDSFVTLEQLCYRPIVGGGCVVESALEWFNRSDVPLTANASVLQDWVAYCAAYTVADACRGSIGAPTFPYVVLGGYARSHYETATALIVTFPLNNAPDSQGRAEAWEQALLDLLRSDDVQQRVQREGLQLDFLTERSVADEIARGTYKDVHIIVLSYMLIFVYISCALSSGQWGSPAPAAAPSPYALVSCNVPLHTKLVLGLAALLIAMASLLVSLGLVSVAGVPLMPIIAEVIPFLVLAIGIDNVFLLSHSFRRQAAYLSLQTRLALTLSEVGVGITLAAASECGAFLLGASTDMPAVQAFAVISAVAIAVGWAMQVTVFCAVLVLDARRMEQGRWDLCCCVQDEEVEEQVKAWKRSRTQGGQDREEEDFEAQIDPAAHLQHQHPDLGGDDPFSAPSQSSPSGSTPPLPPFSSTSPFSSESYLQRFMRRYYLPFLFHPFVRLLVLLLFPLAFCWLLYYGLTHLQLGLDQSTVVPDDSYLKPYFASEAAFLNVGPPVFFVVREPDAASASPPTLSYNYSSLSFQDRICSNSASCDDQSLQNLILSAACTPGSFIAQSATSWLDTYMVWLSTPDCCSYDPAAPGVLLPIGSYDQCSPSCKACFNSSAATSAALFDRPDAAAFEQWMQPWLVNSSCGEYCAFCSAGLFDSIAFTTSPLPNSSTPLVQTTVTASRYMSFHTPLRQQSDYIGAIGSAHTLAARMAAEQQLEVFPYSIIYVYFQQFLDIQQVAVRSICLALVAIFVLSLLLLRCFFISLLQVATIAMIVGDLLGCCAIMGVDVNALSVLNLIMAVGISVEFCIHISARFLFTPAASRSLRAAHALYTVGSSVVEGITLTKVTGICVLAFATSAVFDIYYTRMYAAIVVLGALHGLLWLPVLLSVAGSEQSREASTGCCGGWMWGWPCAAGADKEEEVEWVEEEEEEEEEEEVDEEEEEQRAEDDEEEAEYEEEEEELATDDENERVQAAPTEAARASYVRPADDWRQALLVEEQQANGAQQRRLRLSNR